ncbi:MAG: MFS transporter [Acidimicrobiales bacterium]
MSKHVLARRLRIVDPVVGVYAALTACLASGYGVLFTLVGDFRDRYGISEATIGLIIGIGFIAGFASQVLIAPLADRGHARKMVAGGVVINAVGLVMMGVGHSTLAIMSGRIISGLAIGAATPAIRRIVVLRDRERVGTNLGRIVSADVFGFAVGPAISAVMAGPFGLAAPFFAVAWLSLLVLTATWRFGVVDEPEITGQRYAVDLLRIPSFVGAVLLGAGTFAMIGAFDALWDLVHTDLGTPGWLANLGITLFALPLVILGPTGGRLAQTFGPFRVAGYGLVIGALFMTAYGTVPSGAWIVAIAMVHAVNDGLTMTAPAVAIGVSVPADRQAGAHGVLGAAEALTAGVTAIFAGMIYQTYGRSGAYIGAAVVMLLLTVAGLGLAGHRLRRRWSSSTASPAATRVVVLDDGRSRHPSGDGSQAA